ncbi:hypothetical protein [Hyunsoonleella aestuarii]|uniref:DUF5689 domain-containing protein n=1 Tax=Hyunsoonleella aestuarii TaxID=912802 RepID=A0ABP8E7L5_9FLAO|nr:hypothetical protein [Hyunsoonleella aestuarii]
MKKIKFLVIMVAVTMICFSCDDDGGTSFRFLEEGIVPNIQKDASKDAFFDLIKISSGENISVAFSVEVAQGDPIASDIVGFYKTASGLIYKATLFQNATLPGDFTLSANDVVSAFTELASIDDLQLADVLTISASFTRSDGTVLDLLNDDTTDNFSANTKNSALFNTVISYPVSCPSDISGEYTVVSSGFSTDGAPKNNPLVNLSYDVILTDNGGGNYDISDGVAGVYQDWYCAPYGYCFETAGNFTDVCGTLTGSWIESFGCTINLTGTVNEDGTLTIQWSNCFGDTIEEAIYTPKS